MPEWAAVPARNGRNPHAGQLRAAVAGSLSIGARRLQCRTGRASHRQSSQHGRSGDVAESLGPFYGSGPGNRLFTTYRCDPAKALAAGGRLCRGWSRHHYSLWKRVRRGAPHPGWFLRLQTFGAAEHPGRLRTGGGLRLGGLQESEITMLRRLLARLNETMGALREWLKILVMDRGYWGTDLFYELKQGYGVDFVSRVRDEGLEIDGSIRRQLEETDRRWTSLEEERQFSGRREQQRVPLRTV